MPIHIGNKTFKAKPTDIAYKEPFSDSTNKTRKMLTLWASIALLNHFYPIDLENSHVLGLKFSKGTAPPIDGLLGVIVIYLVIVLAVYVYQELSSWVAQADIVALEQNGRSLHDIYAHHGNIHSAIDGASQQIRNHSEALLKVNYAATNMGDSESETALKSNLIEIDVHKQSFENMCRSLSESSKKYGEEIEKTKKLLNRASLEYKSAFVSQLVKVGLLEIALPIILGSLAVLFLYKSVINLILNVVS